MSLITPIMKPKIDAAFPASLRAYWPHEESVNTTLLDVINGHDGTKHGGTLNVEQPGKVNYSHYYNGGYYDLAESTELKPSSFTCNVWVKFASTSYMGVVGKWNYPGRDGWLMSWQSGTFKFPVCNGSSIYEPVTSGYSTGVWYMYTGVVDGSSVRLYVNGVLKASRTMSGSIFHASSSYPFRIGAASDAASNEMVGNIDELRFYDVGFSNSDVSDLYNSY